MNIEYPKNRWFIKFKKGESKFDNSNFNKAGIREKMDINNEIEIWYGESYSIIARFIIDDAIKGSGWTKSKSKIKKNAKDLKGKKFKINIIETIIKRPDSLWLSENE